MEEMEARRIVDSYADMILRISSGYVKSRSEAQDICQTVFLKYITAGKEFASHQDEKASVGVDAICDRNRFYRCDGSSW